MLHCIKRIQGANVNKRGWSLFVCGDLLPFQGLHIGIAAVMKINNNRSSDNACSGYYRQSIGMEWQKSKGLFQKTDYLGWQNSLKEFFAAVFELDRKAFQPNGQVDKDVWLESGILQLLFDQGRLVLVEETRNIPCAKVQNVWITDLSMQVERSGNGSADFLFVSVVENDAAWLGAGLAVVQGHGQCQHRLVRRLAEIIEGVVLIFINKFDCPVKDGLTTRRLPQVVHAAMERNIVFQQRLKFSHAFIIEPAITGFEGKLTTIAGKVFFVSVIIPKRIHILQDQGIRINEDGFLIRRAVAKGEFIQKRIMRIGQNDNMVKFPSNVAIFVADQCKGKGTVAIQAIGMKQPLGHFIILGCPCGNSHKSPWRNRLGSGMHCRTRTIHNEASWLIDMIRIAYFSSNCNKQEVQEQGGQ